MTILDALLPVLLIQQHTLSVPCNCNQDCSTYTHQLPRYHWYCIGWHQMLFCCHIGVLYCTVPDPCKRQHTSISCHLSSQSASELSTVCAVAVTDTRWCISTAFGARGNASSMHHMCLPGMHMFMQICIIRDTRMHVIVITCSPQPHLRSFCSVAG